MTLAEAAATMLSTASPLSPDTSGTPSPWLSDVILPTIVGLGSIAVAVVAIIVAARSNRFARAATAAAIRSNAIAERANLLEEERDQRAQDADARLEREAFRARWESSLHAFTRELRWGAEDPTVGGAWRSGAQLITEGEVRDLYPPHAAAMNILHRAFEVSGDDLLYGQASAAAHALLHDWVRAPDRVDFAVEKWKGWMEDRVLEYADDLKEGRPR